jgi:hypothetical protein
LRKHVYLTQLPHSPDPDWNEANEEEYEWMESLKRELSSAFLFNWRWKFNIGGVRDGNV